MFRSLLSNRGILAGLVFFVIVVGGSVFYYFHVRYTTDAEVVETQRKVQPLENKDGSHTTQDTVSTSTVDFEQTETPLEDNEVQPMSDDTAVSPIDGAESDNLTDAFLPDDFVSEEEIVADVPVSPYGFGPYPEVPEGWPADTFPAPSANHELLARVRIKLLAQGTNTAGANMVDGSVYPVSKGTAYVKWKETRSRDGVVRYVSRMIAHPDDAARLNTIKFEKERPILEAWDIPSDIKLVSFEEGAIDPYTFLELP